MCLLLIFGLVVSSYGTVLCIGADDQIKVESVCEPCCKSTENGHDIDVSVIDHSDHEECFDCTDITFTQDILRQSKSATFGETDSHIDHAAVSSALSHNFAGIVNSVADLTAPREKCASATISVHLASTVIRC